MRNLNYLNVSKTRGGTLNLFYNKIKARTYGLLINIPITPKYFASAL